MVSKYGYSFFVLLFPCFGVILAQAGICPICKSHDLIELDDGRFRCGECSSIIDSPEDSSTLVDDEPEDDISGYYDDDPDMDSHDSACGGSADSAIVNNPTTVLVPPLSNVYNADNVRKGAGEELGGLVVGGLSGQFSQSKFSGASGSAGASGGNLKKVPESLVTQTLELAEAFAVVAYREYQSANPELHDFCARMFTFGYVEVSGGQDIYGNLVMGVPVYQVGFVQRGESCSSMMAIYFYDQGSKRVWRIGWSPSRGVVNGQPIREEHMMKELDASKLDSEGRGGELFYFTLGGGV